MDTAQEANNLVLGECEPTIRSDGWSLLQQLENTEANRTITKYVFSVVDGVLTVSGTASVYSTDVVFSERYIQDALMYDMRSEFRLTDGKEEYPAMLGLDVIITIQEYETLAAINWDGWDKLQEFTFAPKKDKPKISRATKINSLLAEITMLNAELASAEARLRILKSTSPIPHGETGDLTFGSVTEVQV